MSTPSTQITVRIPTDLVAFLDQEVADHHTKSRADLVTRALRREVRRRNAERDAEILAAWKNREDPDNLDDVAAHASRTPLDID
ncbi:YlcI/YnfO family protein [Rhodococcus sp. NPDC054953]